ncbi:hypothetical protein HA402_007847 [Bradysia odoriphaga]|nr:hypothetical protein HA402_007847 [Bradysia odoriphaga]
MPTENSETEFNKILEDFSYKGERNKNKLTAAIIDTPIGELLAVGNDKSIYLLQVLKKEFSYPQLKRITDKTRSHITEGRSKPIDLLEQELKDYFNGTLEVFTTPIEMHGTDFQIQVWNELRNIPFGKQISYAQLADNVKSVRPKSSTTAPIRAVGTANGANRILLLIPCHRVINKNGKLGGFSCGIERKQWLLNHEGLTF